MRHHHSVLALLLIAGCSAVAPVPTPAAPSVAVTSAGSAEPTPAAPGGVCDLLTAAELTALGGDAVGAPRPGTTMGVPNCQWTTSDSGYLQVMSTPAVSWATALPDALRTMEESGLFDDSENAKRLRDGAELIEEGGTVDPAQACELFSDLLVLQGYGEGRVYTVSVVPTREDPYAVAGQACTDGWFTSVMLADTKGLSGELPIDAVEAALLAAHGRSA